MTATAQVLIKGALRNIGAIATGETPTSDELADGLEALQMMLDHWSSKNIMIPYITNEAITTTGAESYTWGTGGTIATARPEAIIGAYVADDRVLRIIDQAKYRQLRVSGNAGDTTWLWYSPEFPLGKLYIWPTGSETIYIDSLKPFTEPSLITSSVAFPSGFDEAIKYNLAVRMASEYGRTVSQEVMSLALSGLLSLETRGFSAQMAAVELDIIKIAHGKYDIESDG